MGSSGFEPPTLRLSGARSNHLSYEPVFPRAFTAFGGDEGNRTPDPLLAGQVLSQLSYTPLSAGTQNRITTIYSFLFFVVILFFLSDISWLGGIFSHASGYVSLERR